MIKAVFRLCTYAESTVHIIIVIKIWITGSTGIDILEPFSLDNLSKKMILTFNCQKRVVEVENLRNTTVPTVHERISKSNAVKMLHTNSIVIVNTTSYIA